MKKIILILLLSISLFSAQNKDLQKVVLQLDWLNQFQFAGFDVAKELGYYKDAGIDVEIKDFTPNTDTLTIIQNKKADFALGHSSILTSKTNCKKIVALGAIFQESPMILLTRDDTGINSIKDLKNKRIMLTSDAKDMASITAMLFSNGLTDKDVHVIPHSFNLDDLINKKTDAMASYISNEPIIMTDRGIGYKVFNPEDYGFNFYGDLLFTSSKFIKNNPRLTKDFYDASIRGWEYAFNNIPKTAELIYEHYNTQHKTLLELIKEGEVLRKMAYSKDGTIGHLDKDKLSDIIKVYKVLGMTTNDIDLDKFIYEYNHPKRLALQLSYADIWLIAVIFILLVASLNFIFLFISLRKKWIHTQSHLKEMIDIQKEKIDKQNKIIIVQSKIVATGEMLNNIAHQWRQPLNIISLSIAKMETSLLFNNEINKEDFLKTSNDINRQTQYLSQTIDDFRNYFNSNIENHISFHLKDVIKKINELTGAVFKINNINSIVTVKDCVIINNENLLIQALLNIYNNAKDSIIERKAADRYFFVDAKCDESNIVITLKDSGGGIKNDIIDKIFDPYFTTKHPSKGTGLGLYITYAIITQHLKGTISVHNTDYEYKSHKFTGAEFVIIIPTEL